MLGKYNCNSIPKNTVEKSVHSTLFSTFDGEVGYSLELVLEMRKEKGSSENGAVIEHPRSRAPPLKYFCTGKATSTFAQVRAFASSLF